MSSPSPPLSLAFCLRSETLSFCDWVGSWDGVGQVALFSIRREAKKCEQPKSRPPYQGFYGSCSINFHDFSPKDLAWIPPLKLWVGLAKFRSVCAGRRECISRGGHRYPATSGPLWIMESRGHALQGSQADVKGQTGRLEWPRYHSEWSFLSGSCVDPTCPQL